MTLVTHNYTNKPEMFVSYLHLRKIAYRMGTTLATARNNLRKYNPDRFVIIERRPVDVCKCVDSKQVCFECSQLLQEWMF